MFTADGSEGERCAGMPSASAGKYVYDHGICPKTELVVETLGGDKYPDIECEDGKVFKRLWIWRAGLTSSFQRRFMGMARDRGICWDFRWKSSCRFILREEIDGLGFRKIGPAYENHERFPKPGQF